MAGRKRSWTIDQLKSVVAESTSYWQVIEKLGLIPAGGNYAQLKKYVLEHKVDTAHFTGKVWNKGLRGIGKPRITLAEILVQNSSFQSYKLKARLFKAGLKPQHCEQCRWAEVTSDGYLPLELDHINGDRTDNRLENLRVLCPNCHSLTPHHRGRGGRKK